MTLTLSILLRDRRSPSAALLFLALAVVSASSSGLAADDCAVRLRSPLPGSVAYGPSRISIETDMQAQRIREVEFRVDEVPIGFARTPPYGIDYDFGATLAGRRIDARVHLRDAPQPCIAAGAVRR